MLCGKCGANAYLEEEFNIAGSIFSLACRSCGWRGPVLIDNRIKLNKTNLMCGCILADNEEDKMPYVLPEEKKTKLLELLHTGKSMRECSKGAGVSTATATHYRNKYGIKKHPVGVHEYKKKETKVFVSDGKSSEIVNVPNKVETKDVKEILEQKPGKIIQEQYLYRKHIQITIPFITDDIKLFQELEKNCKMNRRTIENEILFIISEHIKRNNNENSSKT